MDLIRVSKWRIRAFLSFFRKIIMILLIFNMGINLVYAGLPGNYVDLSTPNQIEALMIFLDEDRENIDFVKAELKEYGSSIVPQLYSLMDKYYAANNFNLVNTIISYLANYPNIDTSVDKTMILLRQNEAFREAAESTIEQIYNISKTDKAYRALIEIYRDYRGHETLLATIIKEADKTKIPILLELLTDAKFNNGDLIIKRLVEVGEPSVILSPIINQLKSENESVRIAASEGLGDIGDKVAIPSLKEALRAEKKKYIKLYIAGSVVKLGDFQSADFFLKMLQSVLIDDRGAAREWLIEISGQDFGDDLSAWRKWYEDEKVRRGL